MGTEETRDVLKNVDWKTLGGGKESTGAPVVKKRLPKKLRRVPDYYFLPRMSTFSALALSAAVCAAGVGAGMLVEVWINKKIEEDGGVIWEFDK
ncbi:krueppel-like factor [Wolffia australiana]